MLKDGGPDGKELLSVRKQGCFLQEGWCSVWLSGCINVAELGDSLMGKLWAGRLGLPLLMLAAGTGAILSHG